MKIVTPTSRQPFQMALSMVLHHVEPLLTANLMVNTFHDKLTCTNNQNFIPIKWLKDIALLYIIKSKKSLHFLSSILSNGSFRFRPQVQPENFAAAPKSTNIKYSFSWILQIICDCVSKLLIQSFIAFLSSDFCPGFECSAWPNKFVIV